MGLTAADIQQMAIEMEKVDGPGQGAWALRCFWPNLDDDAVSKILNRTLILTKDNKVRIAKKVRA